MNQIRAAKESLADRQLPQLVKRFSQFDQWTLIRVQFLVLIDVSFGQGVERYMRKGIVPKIDW